MLSGRGLCDELITRPEESYQLWCIIVCDLMNEEALAQRGGYCAKNKQTNFMTNSNNYSIYTGHSSDLHLPQTNLVVYQKGVCYSDVKFFNNLPSDIKNTSGNLKTFKRILKLF